MRRAAFLICALALAGCHKESRSAAPPIDNSSGDAAGSTAPAADAGPDPCVTACIADNQMRATSPEQIEADCRRDCAK